MRGPIETSLSDNEPYAVRVPEARVQIVNNKCIAILPDGTIIPAEGSDEISGEPLLVNKPDTGKRVIFPWEV
jgi:hypothetical protein